MSLWCRSTPIVFQFTSNWIEKLNSCRVWNIKFLCNGKIKFHLFGFFSVIICENIPSCAFHRDRSLLTPVSSPWPRSYSQFIKRLINNETNAFSPACPDSRAEWMELGDGGGAVCYAPSRLGKLVLRVTGFPRVTQQCHVSQHPEENHHRETRHLYLGFHHPWDRDLWKSWIKKVNDPRYSFARNRENFSISDEIQKTSGDVTLKKKIWYSTWPK